MKRPEDFLFSIIVPVYNRPDEVAELLDSLDRQTDSGFELVLVEDGSTIPALEIEEDTPNSPRQIQNSKFKIHPGPG